MLKNAKKIKTLARVLILVPLTLAISACGLNQLVFLYPINSDRVTASTTGFTFYHNTNNDIAEFLGYEIFYKFYPEATAAAAMEADRAYFYERYITTENNITSRGFQSFYRNGYRDGLTPASGPNEDETRRPNRPFLPVPSAGTTYAYLIDFPTVGEPGEPLFEIYSGYPPATTGPLNYFSLYRTARTTPLHEKSFQAATSGDSSFQSGDADLAGLPAITSGVRLYVGICVVAYGSDQNFSPLYSEAVLLNACDPNGVNSIVIQFI
jgi:hypothetical protein